MIGKYRLIYRLLRANPQARIFMINLWTHARLGAISKTAIAQLLALVHARAPIAEAEVRLIMNISAGPLPSAQLGEALWRELEDVAIDERNGFLMRPLDNSKPYSFNNSTVFYTILDAKGFTSRYFRPELFLEHCGFKSTHAVDHGVAEQLLHRHLDSGSQNQGSLEKNWLRSSFREIAKSRKFSPTYRTRIPAFWIRTSGPDQSPNATRIRNLLGLVHFGNGTPLIEISLSTTPFESKPTHNNKSFQVFRPNTLGCSPGRRFRAARPSELTNQAAAINSTNLEECGFTIDLEQLAIASSTIEGAQELIAREIPWISYPTPITNTGISTEEELNSAANKWWDDFTPDIKYLGKVSLTDAIERSDSNDLGFAERLRADILVALAGKRVPRFGCK